MDRLFTEMLFSYSDPAFLDPPICYNVPIGTKLNITKNEAACPEC